VQQLYKEAGNSWLVILNEITQEGEKQKQMVRFAIIALNARRKRTKNDWQDNR
jgi:hypothetical protein